MPSQPLQAFRLESASVFKQNRAVDILDQLLLPHTVAYDTVSTIQGAFDAIKSMKIRGAPAIASLAALGIAAELLTLVEEGKSTFFLAETSKDPSLLQDRILEAAAFLLTSRPTAVNLQEALLRIKAAVKLSAESGDDVKTLAGKVIDIGVGVWEEDKERNKTMGDHGAAWILEKLEKDGQIQKGEKINVLTVCNTGSLATSGYGTALGVITSLHLQGRLAEAYFAQTGPYQQGARLTSLELASLGTSNTMVCDTAIGALIGLKRIHLFVAGADRIAANGDTANKISTFQIATLCKHPHPLSPNAKGVATLVAAPLTTIDLGTASGKDIPIEQRPSWEACVVRGRVVDPKPADITAEGGLKVEDSGEFEVKSVLVTPPGTRAWNPAFDVTPASLIDGIVTELGVFEKKAAEYDLKSELQAAPL